MPQLRLAEGVDPAEVTWPDLGYADAYLESYQTFAALRDEGVIPAGVRFQVQYPTPLASIGGYIVPEQQQALLGSYERAMFADLDRLLTEIPHGDVAVQWDVAVEFGVLESAFAPDGAQAFDAIIAALARCVDQLPAEIPAGMHLCYGDYGHQHFKQPESLALQVRVLNAVAAAAGRPVSFVSFTVPQYQRDESYFAPLAGLTVDPDTELNFALVPYHPAEQAPGTTREQVRLIDAALAASPGGRRAWGICTECGMGRAPGRDPSPAGPAPRDHRGRIAPLAHRPDLELPSRSGTEPVLGRPRRDLGPGAHLQLAPDVLHMRLGGPRRDGQPPGDGLIGQPLGDQFGHLELTAGQLRPRGSRARARSRASHPGPRASRRGRTGGSNPAAGSASPPGSARRPRARARTWCPVSASRCSTAVRARIAGSKALMSVS